MNANFSVDTFFVMGGVLAGYPFLRGFRRRQINFTELLKDVPKAYLHRYLR